MRTTEGRAWEIRAQERALINAARFLARGAGDVVEPDPDDVEDVIMKARVLERLLQTLAEEEEG
jgi:hypothetical protein